MKKVFQALGVPANVYSNDGSDGGSGTLCYQAALQGCAA